ncbi:MAG TPA: alpha/beta hydrolase [Pseudolabrys sp.]|nr:alpha/beta hydrolase [Pseudolabrys sp.]
MATDHLSRGGLSRRVVLGGAAALTASPALAAGCQVGPPAHEKGPLVWMGLDQIELDASYDQSVYAPLIGQITKRFVSASAAARVRLGAPKRLAYGSTLIEAVDVFTGKRANAPIFVFIHGGAWLRGEAKAYHFIADLFVNAGVNLVLLDFINVGEADGDLTVMADQVRRGIAWTYKNAASFGGDAGRLYIGGHSSGGHLAGVALVTDWQKDFGLPADCIKGGLLMSGMYEMKPVRLSKRSSYVKFTDAMEAAMSSQRRIEKLRAPIVVTYGTNETPEFQRQNRDFAAAVKAAGKPAELIEAPDYNHFEMCESLGNPYGPNGRAALKLMQLST